MKLTKKERRIIKEFKRRAERQFPGEILSVMVFGSKARGDATGKSDIDILVVTPSEDWRLGDRIREIGYELDEEIGFTLSIQVISKNHFTYLRDKNFQFVKNIEQDGIAI
jgi:predicted nucleotidyltransferase